MNILIRSSEKDSGGHIVLMFGIGMIGASVKTALIQLGYVVLGAERFDWNNHGRRNDFFEQLEKNLNSTFLGTNRISVCWAAGKANFYSTTNQVERENQPFEELISFIVGLDPGLREKLDFHYISSAGGLFEGQFLVNLSSQPKPMRPYGSLKLRQEVAIESEFDIESMTIYRPSTVYGPMKQKQQKGLINNLIKDIQKGTVTTLDSKLMSLRDYVFAGDVGKFVARSIYQSNCGRYFLVSARNISIYEVVKKTERVLKKKVNVRYDEYFGNNTDITFSEKLLPRRWNPVSLEVGIRQFML